MKILCELMNDGVEVNDYFIGEVVKNKQYQGLALVYNPEDESPVICAALTNRVYLNRSWNDGDIKKLRAIGLFLRLVGLSDVTIDSLNAGITNGEIGFYAH